MADENVTLEVPASEEQPGTQAVESVTQEAAPAPDTTVTETPAPKLYAGKYKTVEELEAAYQNTSSEASRMSQRLAAVEKPKTEKAEGYSAEQLETWKEGRLLEVSQAQSNAARAYAEGRHTEAQQYEAQARESAKQIRLIDAELRKLDLAKYTQSTTRKVAEETLLSDAVEVLHQYRPELVPGTELHTKASAIMHQYGAMGYDLESPLVQAQAVSLAAQRLGLSSKKVAQITRKELTSNLTQALKDGVVQGAGKASKSASTTPDFTKMTDAEFVAYKRQRGWD